MNPPIQTSPVFRPDARYRVLAVFCFNLSIKTLRKSSSIIKKSDDRNSGGLIKTFFGQSSRNLWRVDQKWWNKIELEVILVAERLDQVSLLEDLFAKTISNYNAYEYLIPEHILLPNFWTIAAAICVSRKPFKENNICQFCVPISKSDTGYRLSLFFLSSFVDFVRIQFGTSERSTP